MANPVELKRYKSALRLLEGLISDETRTSDGFVIFQLWKMMMSDEKRQLATMLFGNRMNYCYDWKVFGTPSEIFERLRE